MIEINEIEEFIKSIQDLGALDNSYWVALILKERFRGTIYFYPQGSNFMTKISRSLYTADGDVTNYYKDKELIKILPGSRILRTLGIIL